MLTRARSGSATPPQLGCGTQSLTVFVEDVDAHFQRAKSARVKIREDLHETVYGELQYAAEDLDGHHWLFSRHARDLSPGEWGATETQAPPGPLALLPRPRLCYLASHDDADKKANESVSTFKRCLQTFFYFLLP